MGSRFTTARFKLSACHEPKVWDGSLARFLTRDLHDADRPLQRLRRHPPLGHAAQELIDEARVLDVLTLLIRLSASGKAKLTNTTFGCRLHADHPFFGPVIFREIAGVRCAVMSCPLRENTTSTGLPPLLLIMS